MGLDSQFSALMVISGTNPRLVGNMTAAITKAQQVARTVHKPAWESQNDGTYRPHTARLVDEVGGICCHRLRGVEGRLHPYVLSRSPRA